MSSSFSLLPQQYLIALQNLDEMLVALSHLSSLPPSLVCLCPTTRQCEWLKSKWPKGSAEKKVIFLSSQKLCQARERRRHLQQHSASVWLLPFFELMCHRPLYHEVAESVAQIWAMSWGMSVREQKQWAQLSQSSRLTPILCSRPSFLDRFHTLEKLIIELWHEELQKQAAYRLALGQKHLLVYTKESDLRFWRLWARHQEVSFSLDPFDAQALLGVIHAKEFMRYTPDQLCERELLICSSARQAPEVRYALGFSRLSRPNSSLLRCAQWAGLVARRQIRWL